MTSSHEQNPERNEQNPQDSSESKALVPADDAPSTAILPSVVQRYVDGFQQRAEQWSDRCDAIANYIVPRNEEVEASPENLARSPIVFGMVMAIILFGIFGLWAVLAPIDSAAIAQGNVMPDSNRKTIDHLEGGIVSEILVKEGEVVEAGQVLVVLDDTAAKARRDLYRGQYVAALATEARLIAERDNAEEVQFPPELTEQVGDDVKVAANLDSQRRLFQSRRESLQGQTDVLQQQIKQSEEEINGLTEQITSSDRQLELLADEIKDVRFLLESGNAAKTRLLALQRRQAEIQGEKGERQAMIARAEQRINEAKIEMFNLKTRFLNEVVGELRDTQVTLSDLEEQLRAAEDVMKRIDIRAPIAGQITGLAVHTVGGVIAPGEPIMDIVPNDDRLIVEARVRPQDIDLVRPGLLARVRLLAFKVRDVPPVEGIVETVSADRFQDERTGESYFTARIEIDESQLEKLDNVELSSGMPTEVLIVTGSRSLFSYLISPIKDSFNRAFREQ